MGIEISVICLTYNSDINKLLTTLNSVIQQRNCNFEIIIADDGSGDNKFGEVEAFFDSNDFQNYKLIPNVENKGIIKNFLSAIILAKGEYIKYISPGDYLYDEYTLEYIYGFMHKYNAPVAFGRAVYYSEVAGILTIFKKRSPVVTQFYDADSQTYDFRLVLKHIMLYGDPILGAAIVANRDEFEHYLKEIENKVVYIEDNTILPLMTLDKKRIYYINRYILWYEYKSGISTRKNSEFDKKIKLDFYNYYQFLTSKYPDELMVKIGGLLRKYTLNNNTIFVFFIKRLLDIAFGRMCFRLKRKMKERNINLSDIQTNNFYTIKKVKRSN